MKDLLTKEKTRMIKKSLVLAFVVILAAVGRVRAESLFAGNFKLSIAPPSPPVQVVYPGGTATFTLAVTPEALASLPPQQQGEIELAGAGPLSHGITVSVSPTLVQLGAATIAVTGTVVVAGTTPKGTYSVAFTAIGATHVSTVTAFVVVE